LAYTAEANTTSTITNLFSIITTALTAGSTSSVPIATTGSTNTIFVKTGTYAEILPISIPDNTAVVGDELRGTIIEPAAGYTGANMFYMRNGTGLRNCTLRGLYGGFTSTLPSGTKRTSGGSFVSLDPVTGLVTPIGNASLSTTINTTGVSLNPYELSYSYQDEDSWLSISLLDGSILSDVTVTLPNTFGDFNNFRFNTADSTMYGLYSQVIYNPTTGTYSGDMRLATCDLSTGAVSLVSPSSIATSYTMAGAVINPHLMVYYFITQGNLRGLDLYNGTIFSDPQITIPSGGNSFDNFAYSCADTTMYGLIMQNGVKCLGKIDVTTGVVDPLPTLLNLDNYVMNAATIDPVNGIYYFETSLAAGITLLGLSLVDGSIVLVRVSPTDAEHRNTTSSSQSEKVTIGNGFCGTTDGRVHSQSSRSCC
jgi:hypothetical protein